MLAFNFDFKMDLRFQRNCVKILSLGRFLEVIEVVVIKVVVIGIIVVIR